MESDDDYPLSEHRSETGESADSVPKVSEQEQKEAAERVHTLIQQRNAVPEGIKLFLDLPTKTEEAQRAYDELEQCTYQYKYLGLSGQDLMSCMCQEEVENGTNIACNDEDCINRGTKIECVNGAEMSMCGDDCANQRFQRREYAKINIIQTDMKGYGVRAEEDLEPDAFIWEYVGEVIEEKAFKKRMVEYDAQKRRHFYFMMLQKGEFIDATQKGSLGRFCNHSCNPNCYVEKWVVNDKLKMGIFAKRRIIKGEELTFNYNVDRYGADAQTCHCGEPNCIGVIGGKTQTEAASLLPVNISRALGSSVDDEQAFLKELKDNGTKPDDINTAYLEQLYMKPVGMEEVPVVMSALLQAEDSLIIAKLLERIEKSTDGIVNLMKSNHGFNASARILRFSYNRENKNAIEIDDSIVLRVLAILMKWKSSKDYLERAGIRPVVEELSKKTESSQVQEACQDLQKLWSTFEEYRRIKKKDPNTSEATKFHYDARRAIRQGKEQQQQQQQQEKSVASKPSVWKEDDLPGDWFAASSQDGSVYYFNKTTNETSWEKPSLKAELKVKKERFMKNVREREQDSKRQLEIQKNEEKEKANSDIQRIIEEAKRVEQEKLELAKKEQAKEEKRKRKKEEDAKKRLLRTQNRSNTTGSQNSASPASSAHGGSQTYGEEEFRKLWKRHFAQHIPNMIKKYQDQVGLESIKGCARDIVDKLVDKEFKKDASRKPPSELTLEKRKKIKLFTEPYMEKVREKVEAKKRKAEEARGASKKQHL